MESRQEIRLVVFDWAGTTVDYGSSAPGLYLNGYLRRRGSLLPERR